MTDQENKAIDQENEPKSGRENKIDLRLDDGLKAQVEDVAVRLFGARMHHISKRPELTTTLNRLIKIGLEAVENDATLALPAPLQGEYVPVADFQALASQVEELKKLLVSAA